MKNPNAFTAALAAGATIGVQWLVQRYAHQQLSDYWKTTVTSTITVGALYVGKAGIKDALLRIWSGPKKLWSGATSKSSSTTKAAAS